MADTTAPRRRWLSRALLVILRLGVGGLFIYASIEKLIYPDQFADIVHEYQFLPMGWVNLAAVTLPWIELAMGACLIAGIWVPGAALISVGLTLMFIGGIAWALGKGVEDFHCGCFTTLQEETDDPVRVLWRDGWLLAATVALFVMSYRREVGMVAGPMAEPAGSPALSDLMIRPTEGEPGEVEEEAVSGQQQDGLNDAEDCQEPEGGPDDDDGAEPLSESGPADGPQGPKRE
jgi:uncharacterized membrane protein YphA (DoxX/SURF4 family)